MPKPSLVQQLQSELSADQERLDELNATEADLLRNIPHGNFRVATEEANIREEKEALVERMRRTREMLADAKNELTSDG